MEEKTRIIVVGAYGRMGQEICRLVKANGNKYELAGAVDQAPSLENLSSLGCAVNSSLSVLLNEIINAVVVDFTNATASFAHAGMCAEKNVPIVIGATGYDERMLDELKALATVTPILWSANMSVGINVLMRILPLLAEKLGSAYDMEMVEIHHRHKKDAPSGTALMLGDALAKARGWKLAETRVSGRDGMMPERKEEEIGIMALRGGSVPGIHSTWFLGSGETIEVTHQAQSRENFAMGALRAAAWLKNMPAGNLYSMQDVIFGV